MKQKWILKSQFKTSLLCSAKIILRFSPNNACHRAGNLLISSLIHVKRGSCELILFKFKITFLF